MGEHRPRPECAVTDESRVVGVVVTYRPDVEALCETVRRLSGVLSEVVLVDNSIDPELTAGIDGVHRNTGATLLRSPGNVGIAAAQNRGVRHALDGGADYVLFLDDDSDIGPDAVRELVARTVALREESPSVVASGPLVVDERTRETLTFVWRGRHLTQLRTVAQHSDPTVSAFLLSSGSLISSDAFSTVGAFREDYFIDHVDKEWGLRAGSAGATSVVFPSITLTHNLGDVPTATRRSGTAVYTHHSSARDYYLTRNACHLFRDLDLPQLRYVGMLRLLVESSIRKIVRPQHDGQRRAVLRGLWDGIRNVRGVMP